MNNTTDVVIIGAGAAGLMCAIEAGKRGRKVVVVEKAEKIGKKILISGGGRCNFTNRTVTRQNYISRNPHFCTSALSRFTPHDFISLVEKHNIAYHEKKLGQLFCDDSARQIVEMLHSECLQHNVHIHTNTEVHSIEKADETFTVHTSNNTYTTQSLVIASGGKSIPKMGATGFGYTVAKQFGLKIIEPIPALVPFTFTNFPFSEASGASLDVEIECNGSTFRENILCTHKGLSGPAILQISSYWNHGDTITINLFPDTNVHELLTEHHTSKTELKNFLSPYLGKRFAEIWCELYLPSKPLAHYTHKQIESIATQLQHWQLLPTGTEGFAKAEVTRGGVDTNELSSKTMEAKRIAGLYFIGEVVDVTGWLGGYNFQWAWASGFAAGQYV